MVIFSLNADLAYDYLVNTITMYLNECTLIKKILVTGREYFREPWMNIKLCKYKKKCLKLFKKAKLDPTCYDKYRNYRHTLNRLKLFEKRKFYDKLFVKIGKNSKTMWSVLNLLVKKS